MLSGSHPWLFDVYVCCMYFVGEFAYIVTSIKTLTVFLYSCLSLAQFALYKLMMSSTIQLIIN